MSKVNKSNKANVEVKIGCDIVNIKRFSKLDKKALNKIFHKSEMKKRSWQSLAGMFAAKESCKKVFNDLNWHDIEIKKEKSQKPILVLHKKKEITSYDISISHDARYAIATVVFLTEKYLNKN